MKTITMPLEEYEEMRYKVSKFEDIEINLGEGPYFIQKITKDTEKYYRDNGYNSVHYKLGITSFPIFIDTARTLTHK